ncbi:hypothetical protein O3P69_002516 [Scylla paramamosain]|uniref:Uncharacterized protein n=1 Tax=Scylla paramamosain TaxID=85552 RepID=A0AAW0UL23_SCYPA
MGETRVASAVNTHTSLLSSRSGTFLFPIPMVMSSNLHFLLHNTFTHIFHSVRGRSGTPFGPASRSGSRVSLTAGRPSSRSLPLCTPKEEEEDEGEEEKKEEDAEDSIEEEEERDHSVRTRTYSELSRDTYRARHSRYCKCASTQEEEEEEEDEDEDEDEDEEQGAAVMVEARVVYASSHDPAFPPSAMLDGRPDTFWASTGLFPQVVVITLPAVTSLENLSILAYNVRRVSVARSVKALPTDFEDFVEKELPQVDGKLQNSVLSEQVTAAHLRLTITEGHGHFCSLHQVSVVGTSAKEAEAVKVTAVVASPKKRQHSPTKVMPKVIPVRKSGMDGGMDLTLPLDLTPTDDDEF